MSDAGTRLEQERRDADRRYNDALTAFDRAMVRAPDLAVPPAAEATIEPVAPPAGVIPPVPPQPQLPWWRGGGFIRELWRHLTPVFEQQRATNEAQRAFNAAVTASLARELAAAADRDRANRQALDATIGTLGAHFAALERFESALLVFLQQITGFVESKERIVRQLEAAGASRLDQHQRALDAHQEAMDTLPELREEVMLLQRTAQMLKRELETMARPPAAAGPATAQPPTPPAAPVTALEDFTYVGFEDRFRGSDDEIREKLRGYVPLFAGASDVLDIGCGRGEFLALLQARGVTARGVDTNYEMVEVVRERGLVAAQSDALGYLESVPNASLGGLMAAQVIEHLQPAYLVRLLITAYDKLRPGAPIVLETINPACWYAFFSSYIRDLSHVRPIHPETMQYLLQASGFGRVSIRYSAAVPDHMKISKIELPADLDLGNDKTARALYDAAHVVNVNGAILNKLMFTHLDYAAIGYRS